MATRMGIKWGRRIEVVEVAADIRTAEIYRFEGIGISRQGRGHVVEPTGYPMGDLDATFHDNDIVVERLHAIKRAYLAVVEGLQKEWDEERAKLLPITEETK